MNKIYPINPPAPLPIPLYLHRVRAGFPSPADDHMERRLDLNEHVIKHPSATYYVRAQGDSMEQYGIYCGDLLVVDRSLEAVNGDVVIAVVGGSLACKVLDLKRHQLLSGNTQFPPIPINGTWSLSSREWLLIL